MYNILVSCHTFPLNITAITFAEIGHEDLLLYGCFFLPSFSLEQLYR